MKNTDLSYAFHRAWTRISDTPNHVYLQTKYLKPVENALVWFGSCDQVSTPGVAHPDANPDHPDSRLLV
jgi:hypothetical protein